MQTWVDMSRGVPICSIRAQFITQMLSEMASTSS
jgi:hypothetical protein